MRKRIATPTPATAHAQEDWLDLERTATVEVTSEDIDFPIESSLSIEPSQGWRAAQPGTQTIRLVFDEPQELKRILLVFEEKEITRTQEFVLRASSDPVGRFERLCVSNGISAHLRQLERSRSTVSNFRTSAHLN
jgi:hypothetical protein